MCWMNVSRVVLDDPKAEHHCGQDLYRVSYDFAPDTWLSVWEVEGPAKDYSMTTRYRRVLPPPH